MKVTKLNWAGILIESKGYSVLIDPIGSPIANQDLPFAARVGEPHEPIISLSDIHKPDCILITHTHPDHFDSASILASFGRDIPLYVPSEVTHSVEKMGFSNVVGANPNDTFSLGAIHITASYSVDGFGTPQVSWVVNDGYYTIIHCGDTLWHGYWWKIAQKHGPIHVAFLPVNGPILYVTGLNKQSNLPACLTPEQAVEAAKILEANYLVPIHYGTFHNPPFYQETDNMIERLRKSAHENEVTLKILKPNSVFMLTD